MLRAALVIIYFSLLTGCAVGPTPQNAVEFRAGIKQGGFGTSFETYEVGKSHEKVAAVVKKKAGECFNISLVETQCINNSCQDYDILYKPTFVSNQGKSELYLQWKRVPDNAVYLGGDPPAGGMYVAVFDFTVVAKDKTKVEVYAPSMGFVSAPKAVKHWVNGTNMGCPDFTQGY